jgi:hypothetical protein
MEKTPFPRDLITLQRQWTRTYAALERRPLHTVELRRRLQQLSARLAGHPFWATAAGRSPSAKVELRRRVREIEEAEKRLSEQQLRILECIRDWTAEHNGESPSVREIGRCVGLTSSGSVAYQLGQLEQLGVLDRSVRRGKGRGIALLW